MAIKITSTIRAQVENDIFKLVYDDSGNEGPKAYFQAKANSAYLVFDMKDVDEICESIKAFGAEVARLKALSVIHPTT